MSVVMLVWAEAVKRFGDRSHVLAQDCYMLNDIGLSVGLSRAKLLNLTRQLLLCICS